MFIKCYLLALICAAAIAAGPEPNPRDNPTYFGVEFLRRWQAFRTKFNKSYATDTEEAIRLKIFRTNCMAIDEHNALENISFEMGDTFFADMTPREFAKVLGSSPALLQDLDEGDSEGTEIAGTDEEIDYSEDPCIGPVEHQMTCGSCWAFSTLHVAAWHYCKKNGGRYTNFAEQQLVDCSTENMGCTSGFTKTAGKYIVENGVVEEGEYPYKSSQDKCKKEILADQGKLHFPISGTKNLPKNEKSLKPGLDEHGPLMVIIDASQLSFYSKGVVSGTFCVHGQVNHAVVLVGAKDQVWKVKNSWGPEWGENGYFNLEMNADAEKGCLGIAAYPSYALP